MKRSRIDSAVDNVSEQAVRDTGLSIIPTGSVLIVVQGMIVARRVPVAVTDGLLTINQDMKALVPRQSVRADFLAHQLESAQDALFPLIDEAGHGTRRLPTPALIGLPLVLPSVAEQQQIVMAIEHESSQIALTVTRYSREIELVQEYRTRLISDVVTGKLDVRDGAMVGRYDKSATCR